MPPTPIPDGYGEASILYVRNSDGERYVSTFGFHNIGLDSPGANAAAIDTAWNTEFTAGVTLDSYTYAGVYVLQNIGGTLQSATQVENIAGTVAADPVAPAIAVRVTKETLFAGRKFRGRMYLCPALLAEANVNDAGLIDSGTVASIQGNISGFVGNLIAVSLPPYLLHHDGSTPTAHTLWNVRNTVGTQRRRQHLS